MFGKGVPVLTLTAVALIIGACQQQASFRGPAGDYVQCRSDDAACIRDYEQKGYTRAEKRRLWRRSSGCC